MRKLEKEDWKNYIKRPRYFTLCRSKYENEDKLLRLDLHFKGGTQYHYSFNNIKTGMTFTASENLQAALEVLVDRGYEIMIFDKATEYYQYILDFLIG